MTRFDATSADCLVLTYKQGLLSALAHDLELRMERFEIDVDEAAPAVRARVDARSLRAVGAMRNGSLAPTVLSPDDLRKIERSAAEEVLESSRYPEIRFVSREVRREADGLLLLGELTLHGVTRPIQVAVRSEGGRRIAIARLHQPDFGIRPFSALLGALRIQPDVTVRVSLPAH